MKLLELLPDYYAQSPQVVKLQEAFEHWADAMLAAKGDLILQLNVATATWGLALWENILGLETDVSKPYEYRRTCIMSKLRGAGTTTVKMIKNVAESFTNGQVEVTEHPEEYRFTVTFVDKHGIPPNYDDLQAAIEEIKPAHLAVEYVLKYLIWSELDLAALTWDTLDAKELTWDEFELGGWLNA